MLTANTKHATGRAFEANSAVHLDDEGASFAQPHGARNDGVPHNIMRC